jgi:hypothetical protein
MIEYGLLSRLQWEVTSLWTNWCDLECLDEDAFFLFQVFLIAIFGYINLWMITSQKNKIAHFYISQ